jgi:hypothetical protein
MYKNNFILSVTYSSSHGWKLGSIGTGRVDENGYKMHIFSDVTKLVDLKTFTSAQKYIRQRSIRFTAHFFKLLDKKGGQTTKRNIKKLIIYGGI